MNIFHSRVSYSAFMRHSEAKFTLSELSWQIDSSCFSLHAIWNQILSVVIIVVKLGMLFRHESLRFFFGLIKSVLSLVSNNLPVYCKRPPGYDQDLNNDAEVIADPEAENPSFFHKSQVASCRYRYQVEAGNRDHGNICLDTEGTDAAHEEGLTHAE